MKEKKVCVRHWSTIISLSVNGILGPRRSVIMGSDKLETTALDTKVILSFLTIENYLTPQAACFEQMIVYCLCMIKYIAQRTSALKVIRILGILFKITSETNNVVIHRAGRCSLIIAPANLEQLAS